LNVFKKTLTIFLIGLLIASVFSSLNVKPALASNTKPIYWGAWVGSSHIGNYNFLTNFENQVGKGVSIWNWIQIWNRPQDNENIPNFDLSLMDTCRNHGAIPMVSWSPEAGNGGIYTRLQDIIDGKCDAYLTAWGQASASWGHPYFVRPMWEFSGEWTDYTTNNGYGIYPWDSGIGNTPAKFIQAWQHMVNTVRSAGGTQISWVWCPGNVDDSISKLKSVYPGDNYVDWVGTDIYLSTGQTFAQGANPELPNIQTVAPNKPVMLPEIGYSGSDSASYWSNLLTNILPNNYPYIKAVVVWEMPSAGLTVVNSQNLASFRSAISSDYYSSNIYSSLSVTPIPVIDTSNPILNVDGVPIPTNTSFPTPAQTVVVQPLIGINLQVIFVLLIILLVIGILVFLKNKMINSRKIL
jgi:hypothetical protein